MKKNHKTNLILEDYDSEFSYKKSKSNLNISFNRVAFIFFVFLVISLILFRIDRGLRSHACAFL